MNKIGAIEYNARGLQPENAVHDIKWHGKMEDKRLVQLIFMVVIREIMYPWESLLFTSKANRIYLAMLRK